MTDVNAVVFRARYEPTGVCRLAPDRIGEAVIRNTLRFARPDARTCCTRTAT